MDSMSFNALHGAQPHEHIRLKMDAPYCLPSDPSREDWWESFVEERRHGALLTVQYCWKDEASS